MINSIDSLGIPKNWRKSLNILQNIKNPKESQTPEREQMKKRGFSGNPADSNLIGSQSASSHQLKSSWRFSAFEALAFWVSDPSN